MEPPFIREDTAFANNLDLSGWSIQERTVLYDGISRFRQAILLRIRVDHSPKSRGLEQMVQAMGHLHRKLRYHIMRGAGEISDGFPISVCNAVGKVLGEFSWEATGTATDFLAQLTRIVNGKNNKR